MQTRTRIYSYSYLMMASENFLKQAKSSPSSNDPFFQSMSALLFSAFAMEAFLNHAGSQMVPGWGLIKKKLSPRDKLDYLASKRSVNIDWGSRPYQSFSELFRFRNLLAHAETSDVDPELISFQSSKLSHWHNFCNFKIADRICSDVSQMITELPAILEFAVQPSFLLAISVEHDEH